MTNTEEQFLTNFLLLCSINSAGFIVNIPLQNIEIPYFSNYKSLQIIGRTSQKMHNNEEKKHIFVAPDNKMHILRKFI